MDLEAKVISNLVDLWGFSQRVSEKIPFSVPKVNIDYSALRAGVVANADKALHYGVIGLVCVSLAISVSLPVFGLVYGLRRRAEMNRCAQFVSQPVSAVDTNSAGYVAEKKEYNSK